MISHVWTLSCTVRAVVYEEQAGLFFSQSSLVLLQAQWRYRVYIYSFLGYLKMHNNSIAYMINSANCLESRKLTQNGVQTPTWHFTARKV